MFKTSEIQEKNNTGQQEKQKRNSVPYPGFKLGVGRHKVELSVNGGPVIETGEIQKKTIHQEKHDCNTVQNPWFKLGVGRNELKLFVNGPMLETREKKKNPKRCDWTQRKAESNNISNSGYKLGAGKQEVK